ncbi:filamentous hemagglutinin N-terminal domain-containing protein [Variovorax sp. W6]|uniref:two-partner secretion domain-containing protein n=1 Tax=Variovorax sp. W6 TaxID=3093895 RepID=UPI003D8002DC
MNRHLHRVVFNAARGMRMVVQETAASTGKGASKATSAGVSVAIAGALMAMSAQAQIVGAPNVPGNLRPTVLMAPNGVPLVNIQTPSAAGVSRNVYNQFNVGANGAILNNSRVNVQTQLGGFVQGNPFLASGPARIILNEVNGGTPSQLRGYIEVGGQRAEVIIANPAGISVDGGGFINASRATLTTGTPQFNAVGGLDSFLVRGGTVTIDGAGLDASKTDYAAILARAVQANASIWASELKVVTGANQISADHGQITPTTGTGAAPTFALDVAALGGMYANKIVLVGSEAGLGVRNAGSIGAGAGGLVVTAAGRLENIGTLEGQRVELTTPGDISNRGGTIRQTSTTGLTIASPVLSNTNGGVIGAEPVSAGASSGGAATPGTPTPSGGGGSATPSTTDAGGTSTSTGGTSTPTTYTPPAPGVITAGGTVFNDGGNIYAGGPITLNTSQINNAGGSLNVATMAVAGPSFSNAGGTLNVSQSFGANVGSFDNTGGKLNAGSLNIATSGDLINTDGTLTSTSDANLTVGGKVENTRGTISATGALTANVAGATINNSGALVSNQALTLKANSLENTSGSIQSAQAGVQLSVTNALANGGGGSINATTDLSVQAGSLSNSASMRGGNDANIMVGGTLTNDGSVTAGRNTTITAGSVQSGMSGVLGAGVQGDGKLGSVGDLRVTSTGALVANGTNLAAGNATLQGASVDLSTSQTSATSIAVTATQGNVTTSKATVVTPGTLAITANSNAAQTLVNDAGQLNAAQLQINVSNLANTNKGEIVQTGTGTTTIATSGTLNNNGGRIASNGQDLTLQGASIDNASGRIEHAGTGTLTIAGGSFNGTDGRITTNNSLAVALSSAFSQDGGSTSAKQISIDAGSLSNKGGQIVQTGADATRITVVGALDNGNAGVVASNGNTTITAGSLTNQAGSIRAAETSSLGLNIGGLLDNSNKGVIGAGGGTTIAAGSLNNNAGSVTAGSDLSATIAGATTNVGGTLAANGNTTIGAASLDNSAGTTAAVNGNLSVTTTGQTINNGGALQAGGITTLSNGGLLNQSGKVFGDSLAVDTHGNALDNSANGTIAATTTVAISSGALTNDAGLIQAGGAITINTNGQSLSNTNAVGYSNKQGGITSADTLDLKTGALNNTAGFIGSKNALTADTRAFTNTGGLVLGQSTVAIDTHGASYNNNAGKTQAVGGVSINAGDIQNSNGLVRSLATTTLDAGVIVNTNTQGADQGIEGKNVVIGAGALSNDAGAIRADVNATITSGGTVSNKSGLISAGDALALADPNAANPGAKTLNLVNTNGTLVADKSLKIDAATFSGDGRVVSGKDLSIALTQDVVNNGEVAANGNLSYTTSGNFTNNGKLLAGQTLKVGGNNVDNTANAEMSGPNTVVNASGTLTNRGLIDSQGATQINAGTLKNIGTGRIYGDAVSIGVGTLENDSETVNGVTKAGTIAARGTLDIGASTITNREHALIFSSGDMFIGGGLNARREATGQGGTLNNLSADIESLGNMDISMANVNNRDVHIQLGAPKVTSEVLTGIAPKTLVGSGIGRTTTYPLSEVNVDPASGSVFRKDTGELVGIGGYAIWTNNLTITEDTATNLDPARLVAGGNMNVTGRLYNENSQVLAGGTITATRYESDQLKGQRTVTGLANVIDNQGVVQGVNIPIFTAPTTVSLGAYKYQEHIGATQGYSVGVAPVGGVTGNAGGTGGVNGGSAPSAVVEVPANVGAIVKTSGTSAGTAGAAGATGGAEASQTVPMVVRTIMPNIGIPNASLFNIRAGGGYLVETDPRFANYRNWLSSDYLLNSLGLDPNNILKRLGDGFYEQKLIREQVAQLTGYRYLDGYSNDEEQYAALMNAGATFAQQYGLRPGVALTAAQMAQLTSDIVWLVEQTVTLPDGTTQRVLVPQVYVRVRPGDIDGSGALLAGNQVKIDGKDNNLVNTGTIAGRQLVSINANTIDNLGGRISGGQVGLKAQLDINNLGGVIDARDKLTLEAGRDINVRTTTASGPLGNTGIDRVAGLYVTNPGGTLVASAGRDINLVGAIVSNQGGGGLTSFTAKNDINLGTITTSSAILALGEKWSGYSITNKEVGTTITTNGTTLLNAGRDINARQATVDAGNGLLSMHADRDINIASGQTDVSGAFIRQWKEKGLFSRTDNTLSGEYNFSASVGSRFSGGVVSIDAGRDIGIEGSHISGTQGVAISATRNLAIVEGRNTGSVSAELQSDKKGIGGLTGLLAGTPTIPSLPYARATTTSASVQTDTASASTITSSQGGVLLQGGSVFLQGVQVDAAKDISIKGGNVVIQAATNSSSVTGSTNSRTKGIEPGQILWHDPSTGINARKATETKIEDSSLTRTTLNGANVSIEAVDTLAMAGTTVNTPGTLTLKADQLLLGTQTTEHSEQTTSQGRDLAYQKNKDKGQSDQTTNYNQFNAGNLAVTANHVQAGLGARDSVEQLAKQPGMSWVEQLTNNPKLKDKIDWQRVEEAHKTWNYDQQGLTPEGAAIVTIVAAYFAAGAASQAGTAAGQAAGTAWNGGVAALGEGGFIASTGFTVSTAVSGAVTAGITALAGQAAVALINNQGDLAAALHDLGSSANVKNLLTAIVTGGVLGVMDLNPTGAPTLNGGAQPFADQLRQNLTAGAARAVIGTAINGGSFEKILKDSLRNAILDTVAAQTAYEIGNLTQAGVIDDFTNKVAHAIAGCMVGAVRSDSAAGCGAGALGAAIGELAAEAYGRQADTTQFAAMMAGLAVAITGGDANQISLGSQAGGNAAANNFLAHVDARRTLDLQSKCNANQCTPLELDELNALVAKDRETSRALNACTGDSSDRCKGIRSDFAAAAASYLPAKNDILVWAVNKSNQSNGMYSVEQIYDAYNANFFGIQPSSTEGDLSAVADWIREQILREPPLSKIAMGLASYQNQQWAAYFGVSAASNLMAQAKNMLAPEPIINGSPPIVVRNAEILDRNGQVIARQNPLTGEYVSFSPNLPAPSNGPALPASSPNVIRNALTDKEFKQATDIASYTGGVFRGVPTDKFPGIDGWLNDVPVQIKVLESQSIFAINRNVTSAAKDMAKAGYKGDVYIDATSTGLPINKISDFIKTGSPISNVTTEGTVQHVYIKTVEGWLAVTSGTITIAPKVN